MAQFTVSQHINALREEVFAVVSDLRNAAKIVHGIDELEVLTDGPIRVGTRFRETRTLFGKRATEELEVTAFHPPDGFTVETDSCGAHYRIEYRLIPDIAGTHLRVTFDGRPLTLLGKLMSPLAMLMTGPVKQCLEAELEDIRVAVEGTCQSGTSDRSVPFDSREIILRPAAAAGLHTHASSAGVPRQTSE